MKRVAPNALHAIALSTSVLAWSPAHAAAFEISGTTWVSSGTEFATVCMVFEASGTLRFKGGYMFYNPSRWSKAKDGFNRIEVFLGGNTPFPAAAVEGQITHSGNTGLIEFDAAKRKLVYQIGIAEPINFGGFFFYQQNGCPDA